MDKKNNPFAFQLKEVGKLTGARFAVCLHHQESGWIFGIQHGLTRQRQVALSDFLHQVQTASWLAGTLSSGRIRYRQTKEAKNALGCQRIYIFPNPVMHCALLVGADALDKKTQAFYRILILNISSSVPETPTLLEEPLQANTWPQDILETEFEHPYNPEDVLNSVLGFLVSAVACEAALLSIRVGDVFRVEAVWHYPASLIQQDFSIHDSLLLSEMVASREGIFLDELEDQEDSALQFSKGQGGRSWLGIPIAIRQRVIGHIAFMATKPNVFSQVDLIHITSQVNRLAYVVENAIVFAEAARYLQQLALLNELTSAASLGADTEEVAKHVTERLHRTFHTDRVGVFLYYPTENRLESFGRKFPGNYPPKNIDHRIQDFVSKVVETGLPARIQEQVENQEYASVTNITYSALAVPMKYRGRVIGALAMESQQQEAFSRRDEQLLVLIASHLAGLFENMRLSGETRQRAQNLSLIHQVVQRVVGLTDLGLIARQTAYILANNFHAGMVAVILPQEEIGVVMKPGQLKEDFPLGRDITNFRLIGMAAQVLELGESCLIQDVQKEPGYILSPGWESGSDICVPFKDGDLVLGIIDVHRYAIGAFTENELLALEALAGVLSSVVISAMRYRQLQDSVRQLQAVRETALDVAGDLDLEALLRRVVVRARELVDAEGAELGLIDIEEQQVTIRVSETPWQDTQGRKIPFLKGVVGKVAAQGMPLVVSDYNHWDGRLNPERAAPFQTIMGVPLKFRGQAIGTLTVMDSRPEKDFCPEDVQLLEMLAPQVTAWIRNARLYNELQETLEAQRLAENRLIRSARLAAVGEMAAGVAHELNNPLTTVSGFVELVLDELPPDSSHRQDLELVLRESQRAQGVVRRLLDFSRPVENRRIQSDINELVREVLALVYHLARTGGVEIQIQLDESLPLVIIDPGQIKQVLLNLVHNGIQAMPSGGTLLVSTHSDQRDGKDWLVISIQDSGVGISAENMERIFEPFFTTRPAGSGTGLGLSVSYGIVTEHGGLLEAESQPGQGSCFYIYLPINLGELNG